MSWPGRSILSTSSHTRQRRDSHSNPLNGSDALRLSHGELVCICILVEGIWSQPFTAAARSNPGFHVFFMKLTEAPAALLKEQDPGIGHLTVSQYRGKRS